MTKSTSTQILAAFAIASTAACGSNNPRNTSAPNSTANPPAADQRAENTPKPITLTGCLQEDGRTYIVTHLNEPSREGVGTSGSGAAVEREQLREAANAYRVKSKDQSDWDKMVGKQVRVSGSIEKAADLPANPAIASDRPSPTAGSGTAANVPPASTDARQPEKIDKGDLAQIAVDSMAVVSDNCGGKGTAGSAAKHPVSSKKRR